MPDVSIAISARDDYSGAVKTMADTTKRFSKDAEGLQAKLNALTATQTKIKVDVGSAQKSISALRKEYDSAQDKAISAKKTMEEVQTPQSRRDWEEATAEVKKHRDALEEAETAYAGMKRNMELVSGAARQTQKELKQVNAEASKTENRVGGGMGQAADGLKALASAGMIKMAGDVLSQGANFLVGSTFGGEIGSLFGGALSGASSGAAMGSMLGGTVLGLPSVAAGALAGGALGMAQSAIGVAQQRDDAFKGVVQEQYQNSLQTQQASITSGSSIAAGRETDQIAFSKLLGGDWVADKYLGWVKDTANSTPFLYSDLTAMSKTLAAYQYTPEEMQKLLLQVGDTGASLGLSTGDMTTVATSLGRMKSTDKASLEYLNQLTERGIPAMDYLAEKMGKTQKQIYEMISKSQISGVEASQIIANAMGEANKGSMDLQSKTFSGLSSTLEGWNQEMEAAAGEGYNRVRSEGMAEQIAYFEGPEGDRLSKANEMIGEFQAGMENLHDQMVREAQLQALDEIEAKKLTGMEAAAVMQEATVKAENAYMESEGYQLYQDTQKSLVGRLQEDLAGSWENFGYTMAQEFTRGIGRAKINEMASKLDPMTFKDVGYVPELNLGSKHATGLRRVPWDNYPALLHEGERVLTASETRSRDGREGASQHGISDNLPMLSQSISKLSQAVPLPLILKMGQLPNQQVGAAPNVPVVRTQRPAPSVTVTVSGNEFVVRSDTDVDQIAQQIVARMIQAMEVSV